MTQWPETMIVDGQRVNSPYIVMRNGEFWCGACRVRLQAPQHLSKPQHNRKVWYWCFGCTDSGYTQAPHCAGADFESREVNARYWRDSPSSDETQGQQRQAFTARAAGAAGTRLDNAEPSQEPGAVATNYDLAATDSNHEAIENIMERIVSDQVQALLDTLENKKLLVGDQVLADRTHTEHLETLEYRKLLADALHEQENALNGILHTQEEQMKVMTSIQAEMHKMQGEMLAQMRVQAEMLVEVKATNHKVTQVESVVNSLCPRGHSFRRRGEVKTLGASASTGSLLVPYNQHQASGDIEMDARGQSSHA